MFCKKCGREMKSEAKICPYCRTDNSWPKAHGHFELPAELLNPRDLNESVSEERESESLRNSPAPEIIYNEETGEPDEGGRSKKNERSGRNVRGKRQVLIAAAVFLAATVGIGTFLAAARGQRGRGGDTSNGDAVVGSTGNDNASPGENASGGNTDDANTGDSSTQGQDAETEKTENPGTESSDFAKTNETPLIGNSASSAQTQQASDGES